MKFSEIIEGPDGYLNNTTSYFLVLGIYNTDMPDLTGTGTQYGPTGILKDPNGNSVGFFRLIIVQVNQWNTSMTVWNGTTMETEPSTQYTTSVAVFEQERMLIPPGYSFVNFGFAIGFWLSEDEVQDYILHNSVKNNQNVNLKIFGPAVEENPANQSQGQNSNNIGKYLIGGPRW